MCFVVFKVDDGVTGPAASLASTGVRGGRERVRSRGVKGGDRLRSVIGGDGDL